MCTCHYNVIAGLLFTHETSVRLNGRVHTEYTVHDGKLCGLGCNQLFTRAERLNVPLGLTRTTRSKWTRSNTVLHGEFDVFISIQAMGKKWRGTKF